MRHAQLLLLLLFSGQAFAQAPPAAPRPDTVAAVPPAAVPDTAAIHRLFLDKRRQSAVVISATVGIGLLCLTLAESTRHSRTIDATPIVATGISLLSIPATAIELGYYQQFTRRKEQKALTAFATHRLPARIKKRLEPRYFQ